MTGAEIDLKHLQEILYRLIVAPSGVAEGLAQETMLPGDLAQLIASDDRMTPTERVEIYANGYFYRILDVLKEDFPATLAVVGGDNFHNLATGYLIDYPPTEPSIHQAGKSFPRFIAAHPLREHWQFLGDLALLERTTLESFHAADASALDVEAMRAIAPEDWPAIAMRLHPATRLVESASRVDMVLRAVENASSKSAGAIEDAKTSMEPDREEVTIVVWRRNARVSYRALETVEREALHLAKVEVGATFAGICEAVATVAGSGEGVASEGDVTTGTDDGEEIAATINRLFACWLQDGLLVRARL
jgi:hypothetical protein